MEDPKKDKQSPELKEELSDEELKGLSGGSNTDIAADPRLQNT